MATMDDRDDVASTLAGDDLGADLGSVRRRRAAGRRQPLPSMRSTRCCARGDQPGQDELTGPVLNLAAAAAVDSDATADPAELTRPVLRIPLGSLATAR